MSIGNYEDYVARLKKMKPNIYMNGKKHSRDESFLRGGLYAIKQTYDCANDPKYEDVCTATSHLTGEKINRFTHIHQSIDDLLKKQMMTRLMCHRVGGCIQRCMGADALNALACVTYDCDQANNTKYYDRFLKYLESYCPGRATWSVNCAQTDVKGVRGLRPSRTARSGPVPAHRRSP